MTAKRLKPGIRIAAASVAVLLIVASPALASPSVSTRSAAIVASVVLGSIAVLATFDTRKQNRLAEEKTVAYAELAALRSEDEALRTHMAFTLREPITTIVGVSDYLISNPDMALDDREAMLTAIRDDASEVETALSDMADVDLGSPRDGDVEGVVLLDREIESIVSTTVTPTVIESNLEPCRAWGNSAKVRQVLRTVLHASVSSGVERMTVRLTERSGRATVAISAKNDLLSEEAAAALTGNAALNSRNSDMYSTLRTANNIAASMDGTIGYAQAFGISHIVFDLPAAPSELELTPPVAREARLDASYEPVVDIRSKRSERKGRDHQRQNSRR